MLIKVYISVKSSGDFVLQKSHIRLFASYGTYFDRTSNKEGETIIFYSYEIKLFDLNFAQRSALPISHLNNQMENNCIRTIFGFPAMKLKKGVSKIENENQKNLHTINGISLNKCKIPTSSIRSTFIH